MENAIVTVDGSRIVLGFLSDAKAADRNFVPAIVAALESFQNGDSNLLARMVTICNGKSAKRIRKVETGKLVYAAPLKRVLQAALVNVTMKANQDTDFGVVFTKGANGGVSVEVLDKLRELGSVSYRSDAFKSAFPAPEKKRDPKDADKVADAIAKLLADNHLKLGEVLDLVRGKVALSSGEVDF